MVPTEPAPPKTPQDLVDCERMTCNSPAAMLAAYGVEACRACIVREVSGVFGAYGIGVDPRHLILIADYMTHLVGGRWGWWGRGSGWWGLEWLVGAAGWGLRVAAGWGLGVAGVAAAGVIAGWGWLRAWGWGWLGVVRLGWLLAGVSCWLGVAGWWPWHEALRP